MYVWVFAHSNVCAGFLLVLCLQRKQYGEREKQLIQRNSELSLLARRLEENLSAMTAEKASLVRQKNRRRKQTFLITNMNCTMLINPAK